MGSKGHRGDKIYHSANKNNCITKLRSAYTIVLCSTKSYPKGALISPDYFRGWQLLQYAYPYLSIYLFCPGRFKFDGRPKARTDAL